MASLRQTPLTNSVSSHGAAFQERSHCTRKEELRVESWTSRCNLKTSASANFTETIRRPDPYQVSRQETSYVMYESETSQLSETTCLIRSGLVKSEILFRSHDILDVISPFVVGCSIQVEDKKKPQTLVPPIFQPIQWFQRIEASSGDFLQPEAHSRILILMTSLSSLVLFSHSLSIVLQAFIPHFLPFALFILCDTHNVRSS